MLLLCYYIYIYIMLLRNKETNVISVNNKLMNNEKMFVRAA
jgi:hypothetical protein